MALRVPRPSVRNPKTVQRERLMRVSGAEYESIFLTFDEVRELACRAQNFAAFCRKMQRGVNRGAFYSTTDWTPLRALIDMPRTHERDEAITTVLHHIDECVDRSAGWVAIAKGQFPR